MDKKETMNISSMSYEIAFAELEKIIASLEGGEQTLDDAINHYERGKLLSQQCRDLLEKAELKIQTLKDEKSDQNEE
jgi:exodeoxyribonuclease VII small subunit